MKTRFVTAVLLAVIMTFSGPAIGAEFFVSRQGDDGNGGSSPTDAFRTVQKGVDSLSAGDTLTIGSGEYFENVSLADFGDLDQETVIRAAIPGTVVLRGDRDAELDFTPVAGLRFVYAAECAHPVLSVQEYDTLTGLEETADPFALQFGTGRFFYDAAARKLYLSSSDFRSPELHRYTVGLLKGHGLHLRKCKRVVLDGLAASAYCTPVETAVLLLPVSGFMLHECEECTVRHCIALFNASGITINSGVGSYTHDPGEGRRNIIEDCCAYANGSDGIVAYNPERETIRNCRTFLNRVYGARFYGGRATDEECLMQNVLAWGNPSADMWFKGTGLSEELDRFETRAVGEGCVALRTFNVAAVRNCLIGGGDVYRPDLSSSITIPDGEFHEFLDSNFADPLNGDFRLQGSSEFARAKAGGSHVGPHPYEPNVYYVETDGDDGEDGLSMTGAWKTPSAAVSRLKAGDTLYLAPGRYAGDLDVRVSGVTIRGRGIEPVLIEGGLVLSGCEGVSIERIQVSGAVSVTGGKDVELTNCFLAGKSVRAENVQGLTLAHDVLVSPLRMDRCSNAVLSGNLHGSSPALSTDSLEAVAYSSYNSYCRAEECWKVGGKALSLRELQPQNDAYSIVAVPEIVNENNLAGVANEFKFAGRGPLGTDIGPCREWKQKQVDVLGPFVKSSGETSADIQWWSTLPAEVELCWGDTPDCTKRQTFRQNAFYGYSLTGLEPGKEYYVRVAPVATNSGPDPARRFVLPEEKPALVTFTTGEGAAHRPTAYYVATDGNDEADGLSRQTAWKSLQLAADRVQSGDTILLAGGKYPGTFYFRASGEPDRPITVKAIPGEQVRIDGMGETLTAGFVFYGKHHYHLDSLYFTGYSGRADNAAGAEAGAIIAQNCRGLTITRCNMSRGWGRCFEPRNCRDVLLRNCVLMDSMEAMMVYHTPNLVIDHCVFISPLITHLHVYNHEEESSTISHCLFGENTRGKVHIPFVGVRQIMPNNCFYVRWSESDRLVFTAEGGLTLPHYRAIHGGEGPIAANPCMLGVAGFRMGWLQTSNAEKDEDPYEPITFDRFFATNPEIILREIGLQPEAFRDFPFAQPWPYDKEWARNVKDGMDAAEVLLSEGQPDQAAAAYRNLSERFPMSERLKTELLDRAARCAAAAKVWEQAMEIASEIPLKPCAVRRQMAILHDQKKFDELIEQFQEENSITGWTCPEDEQLMADALHYRGMAYAKTGNLAAAEADLRTMVDKGTRVHYQPGPAILDLAWKRLGDFYRDFMKDDAKALEAYQHVIDRDSVIRVDMRFPKPVLSAASRTLAAATDAACAIFRRQGKPAEVEKLKQELAEALLKAREASGTR